MDPRKRSHPKTHTYKDTAYLQRHHTLTPPVSTSRGYTYRCTHPLPNYALVPRTAPTTPRGEGWAGRGCGPSPRYCHPHTQRPSLAPGGAGLAWAQTGDWTPRHPSRCLRTSGELGPAPAPHPFPDRGRTFTGPAQRAAGGRSKPSSSSSRRPTPPARGPPSSGDPAMLPQRAGLRTGGLAGKCAAPGLAGQAAVLCGCAHRGPPAILCPPPPATRRRRVHRAPRSPSSLPVSMEMPKGQGGELETVMAVAMALGGQLPRQHNLLSL